MERRDDTGRATAAGSWGWFSALLGTFALAYLAVAAVPAGAQDVTGGVSEQEIEEETTVEFIDILEVIVHVVHNNNLVESYSNHAGALGTNRLGSVLKDNSQDLKILYFKTVDRLTRLSDGSLEELREAFQDGDLVVCVDEGLASELKDGLGVLPPGLKLAGTTRGREGEAVCITLASAPPSATVPPIGDEPLDGFLADTNSLFDKVLSELVIIAPNLDDEADLLDAIEKIVEWYLRNQEITVVVDDEDEARAPLVQPWYADLLTRPAFAQTAVSSGPWNAIKIFETSRNTTGDYRGNTETAGTHRFTVTVYYLSDGTGFDWYRLDFQTISNISNYVFNGQKFGNTSGNCGWWTDRVRVGVDFFEPAQWFQFMPNTTVGSTTVGFTIGGSVTTTIGGLSAEYSQSYGIPDVKILANSNAVEETVDWTSELQGCRGYEWYPAYKGATDAAKTSCNLNPSLIARVPIGQNLVFKTEGTQKWGFTVEKDRPKCNFACITISVEEYRSTWTNVGTYTCNTSGCN